MGRQVNAVQDARYWVTRVWTFPNSRACHCKECKMVLFTQEKISAVQKAHAEMFSKLTGKFFDGFEKLSQLNLKVLNLTMSERTELLQKARDSENRFGLFDLQDKRSPHS